MATMKKEHDGGDTHDTTITRGDNITNNSRVGFPLLQWIALMLTVIGMGAGSILYIGSIKERVSLVEQTNVEQGKRLDAIQETVMVGMKLRIELQGDVKSLTQTMSNFRDENTKSHEEIKRGLERLSGYKQISAIKQEPDFIR
jgi:hypothetical protein